MAANRPGIWSGLFGLWDNWHTSCLRCGSRNRKICMSLRLRLTLSVMSLLFALALVAAVGVRALTADLQYAVGETASRVGQSMVAVLDQERATRQIASSPAFGLSDAQAWQSLRAEAVAALAGNRLPSDGSREMRVIVNGKVLSPEEIANLPEWSSNDVQRFEQSLEQEQAGDEPAITHHEFRIEVVRDLPSPALKVLGPQGLDVIPLSSAPVESAVQTFASRLAWGSLALLALGLLVAWWMAGRISRPLRSLAEAALHVGSGEAGLQVDEAGPPEVRASLRAFNRMSTDLARLQREAEASRAQRELAELGDIGRGLAHSLRNPLHALGLSVEALAQSSSDPGALQLAALGREQLQRIDQALRGFLALSSGVDADATRVSVAETVDDVLLEASQRAARGVDFQKQGPDCHLQAVAAELRIVLHTLILNAAEASPPGGTVLVQWSALEDGIELSVRDVGEGVPLSVRERLFQPHVSSKPTGAGMGLYLSERIVRQRYRGEIRVTSLPDADATGTISIVRMFSRTTPRERG